jgi:two-component system CheB/CheR fusion protein
MAADHDAAGPASAALVPVVAIGTSAGGLEALERFLRQASPASGLAFVVIQHLDPTHKGMIVELLQRSTAIPVAQVADGTLVEANHVYVIPPNRDLSILHGALYLLRADRPARPAPADRLLLPLARRRSAGRCGDRRHPLRHGLGRHAGPGAPSSAEGGHDGVRPGPRLGQVRLACRSSAVDDGLADIVASAAERCRARILGYLQHLPTLDAAAHPP